MATKKNKKRKQTKSKKVVSKKTPPEEKGDQEAALEEDRSTEGDFQKEGARKEPEHRNRSIRAGRIERTLGRPVGGFEDYLAWQERIRRALTNYLKKETRLRPE